jgi:hypothetical protein
VGHPFAQKTKIGQNIIRFSFPPISDLLKLIFPAIGGRGI